MSRPSEADQVVSEQPVVSVRRIAELAVPALVVLAAEPVYILVDTAVVGHLGRAPLAALAIGGTVMTLVAWLGALVAYGTTGRAARRFGAGDRPAAVTEGVQASWLALVIGLLGVILMAVAAAPLTRVLGGGSAEVTDAAARWLQVAVLGAPGMLLAAAGNGWLRGVQDTRRPLLFVLVPNVLSAILCPVLVYPVGLGLVGSAVANAVAQTLSGALFVGALLAERVSLRPRFPVIVRQLVLSRDLLIRAVGFQASFLSATAVAARFGTSTVAAHQITVQLWFFTALALDALAIAAQSLVGAALGAGEVANAPGRGVAPDAASRSVREARRLARRFALFGGVCGVGFAVVIGAGTGLIPHWFSADPQVYDQTMAAWPWFVAMQPVAGVVFALDGVFIGAGDVGYLRNLTIVAAFGVFLPAIWLAYALDLGIGGIWAGIALFVLARLVALLLRLRTDSWAVVGATR